jgi:outer membrane protein TolC
VKQASLRRQQARIELTFAQRQLLSNLQSFYHEAEAARVELDMLARAAELSTDSLRLTTLRYQAGEASVLDVVDAQNTLVQARNAYDDGQVRYRLAIASLKTLTGNF